MEKSPDAFRTISEVAKLLDTPTHVLRFWESRFPEIAPVRRAGGRRYYRPEDVRLLGGIRALIESEGLSPREVHDLLAAEGADAVAARCPPLDLAAAEPAIVETRPRRLTLTGMPAPDQGALWPELQQTGGGAAPESFWDAYDETPEPEIALIAQDGPADDMAMPSPWPEDLEDPAAEDEAGDAPAAADAGPPEDGAPEQTDAGLSFADAEDETTDAATGAAPDLSSPFDPAGDGGEDADLATMPEAGADWEPGTSLPPAEEDDAPPDADLAAEPQDAPDWAPDVSLNAAVGADDATTPDLDDVAAEAVTGDAEGTATPGPDDFWDNDSPDPAPPADADAGPARFRRSARRLEPRGFLSGATDPGAAAPAAPAPGGFRSRRAQRPEAERKPIQGFFFNDFEQDVAPPPVSAKDREDHGAGAGFSALDALVDASTAQAAQDHPTDREDRIPAAPPPVFPADPEPGAEFVPAPPPLLAELRTLAAGDFHRIMGAEALAALHGRAADLALRAGR